MSMPRPGLKAADAVIAALDLAPHPEGGWYRETYRHRDPDGGRGACSAIYYLLKAGERSAWHRVRDADEIWHWYGGAPLALSVAPDDGRERRVLLGPKIGEGQRPQHIVRAGEWQAADSLGDWTLVGCTVAPAFEFDGFEMAPTGWTPAGGD